jgi:hypothetical protein
MPERDFFYSDFILKRVEPQNSEFRPFSFSQSFEALPKLRPLPKLWSSSIGPETLRAQSFRAACGCLPGRALSEGGNDGAERGRV